MESVGQKDAGLVKVMEEALLRTMWGELLNSYMAYFYQGAKRS